MMGTNESQADDGDGDKSATRCTFSFAIQAAPLNEWLRNGTFELHAVVRVFPTPPRPPNLPLPFAFLDAYFAMEIHNTLT